MLVLTRKPGEKIWIGDNICVTVLDVAGGKIRIGVEAPRHVPVHRQEVLPSSHPAKARATVSGHSAPARMPRLAGSPD